jgi:hypothetical protein
MRLSVYCFAAALALSGAATPCFAEGNPGSEARAPAARHGHPRIKLDRLLLPAEVQDRKELVKHLERVLRREARRADWGAFGGSHIEYRFTVSELQTSVENGVLRVRCTAMGQLPHGKRAKSRLAYGGAPSARGEVVKRVLEIVARGVITRLAELERVRRGELDRSGVRPPLPDETD